MTDENIYTETLRWGYDKVDSGVTFEEFNIFLSDLNVEIGGSRRNALFRELFDHVEENLTQSAITDAIKNNERFRLNLDAVFRHMERIELLEARDGASTALFWARVSLCAAVALGVIQILVAALGC